MSKSCRSIHFSIEHRSICVRLVFSFAAIVRCDRLFLNSCASNQATTSLMSYTSSEIIADGIPILFNLRLVPFRVPTLISLSRHVTSSQELIIMKVLTAHGMPLPSLHESG